ncbi:MAG: hypothetical protein KGM47_12920, partial [Acidobacteriota bacterium]|nr:hypothetical protein [Acidobacteriota bacterium]
MPVSPARAEAFHVLSRFESGRGFAVELLQSARFARLNEADRRLATELVMGVLRWRGDLDFEIESLSGKPLSYFDLEVIEILRLGLYQLLHLKSIPARAAIYEAVEMVKAARKRSASGLVNAMLRKLQRRPELKGATSGVWLERARRSVPSWIQDRWRTNFGATRADALTLACQRIPQVCLRVTGAVFSREAVQRDLAPAVKTSPGIFSRRALRVIEGSVLATSAALEGRVVIQDEASQLVAELVKPEPGHCVLDLCSAPGIKAWQIADNMAEGDMIACDRKITRLETMRRVIRNAWPNGVSLSRVVLDATQPLPFARSFNRILVDAPCSGTGTLARNPEIKWRLRPGDIPRLAGEQLRILQNGLNALARGGRLVYATCSLEPEENEMVTQQALA